MTEEMNWKWKCKDGRELTVKEMSTSHIENVIAKINRSNGWRRRWLPVLYEEYHNRKQQEEIEEAVNNPGGSRTKLLEWAHKHKVKDTYDHGEALCKVCKDNGFTTVEITNLLGHRIVRAIPCYCPRGKELQAVSKEA